MLIKKRPSYPKAVGLTLLGEASSTEVIILIEKLIPQYLHFPLKVTHKNSRVKGSQKSELERKVLKYEQKAESSCGVYYVYDATQHPNVYLLLHCPRLPEYVMGTL